MNQTEFVELHARCVTVLETYIAETRKTSTMLENCTTDPRPFRERFALLTQEVVEKDAHQLYLGAKRILHRAALLGYDEIPNGSSSAAMLSAVKG